MLRSRPLGPADRSGCDTRVVPAESLDPSLDPATLLVHLGNESGPGAPSAPPITIASVFASEGEQAPGTYGYGRDGNPTWERLEAVLGGLEDGQAVVFASGQAAVHALALSLAASGRRLVLGDDGYFNARRLVERLPGVESESVDLDDEAGVVRALRGGPASLWTESPSNPLLRVHDIRGLAQVATDCGAVLVLDNTTATAVLQQPLDLGAIASLYSLTKASSGHSDVILGAVVTRSGDLANRLRAWRTSVGSIPGPFEAWLALRGLRTLALRVKRESENALAVARFLATRSEVRAVHYPGLDGPGLDLAAGQMRGGFGPLLSFEVSGDAAAADRVIAAARLVRPGTSFGGVESSWERRSRWPSETAPPSLIRFSAGIEAIADLLADLEQALERA